jgi:hypothetical protein
MVERDTVFADREISQCADYLGITLPCTGSPINPAPGDGPVMQGMARDRDQ